MGLSTSVFLRAWDESPLYLLNFPSWKAILLCIASCKKAFKMTTKIPVLTDQAPKPLPGIYSQAIIANGVVYCSGAVPMDATTGKLIEGDVKAHTVSTRTKPA